MKKMEEWRNKAERSLLDVNALLQSWSANENHYDDVVNRMAELKNAGLLTAEEFEGFVARKNTVFGEDARKIVSDDVLPVLKRFVKRVETNESQTLINKIEEIASAAKQLCDAIWESEVLLKRKNPQLKAFVAQYRKDCKISREVKRQDASVRDLLNLFESADFSRFGTPKIKEHLDSLRERSAKLVAIGVELGLERLIVKIKKELIEQKKRQRNPSVPQSNFTGVNDIPRTQRVRASSLAPSVMKIHI